MARQAVFVDALGKHLPNVLNALVVEYALVKTTIRLPNIQSRALVGMRLSPDGRLYTWCNSYMHIGNNPISDVCHKNIADIIFDDNNIGYIPEGNTLLQIHGNVVKPLWVAVNTLGQCISIRNTETNKVELFDILHIYKHAWITVRDFHTGAIRRSTSFEYVVDFDIIGAAGNYIYLYSHDTVRRIDIRDMTLDHKWEKHVRTLRHMAYIAIERYLLNWSPYVRCIDKFDLQTSQYSGTHAFEGGLGEHAILRLADDILYVGYPSSDVIYVYQLPDDHFS